MAQENEMLSLHVKSQDGDTRIYKINKQTPILKLLQSHCQRMDINYRTVEFLIKGARFDHKKTPAQLKLKNGSVIDALRHVAGGGGGLNTASECILLQYPG